MEKLTPEQAVARTKSTLAYLSGITETDYGVRVLAKGQSTEHPNNAQIEFTLSREEVKSLPDNVRRIFPVPAEKQQHARRYDSTLVLPDPKGSTVILYIKPITGNHSQDSVSYALVLVASASEMDWVKAKLEARRKAPLNQHVATK